jgi:FkbM family methyltransferase
MRSFNALLYRIHFLVKKSGAEDALRKLPGFGRGIDRLKWLIEHHFLRKAQHWMQIQSGLSKGLWMQIRLPGEALLWRGEHEPLVQDAILAAVRPGDVVYDIGAHVGIMALGTARLVGDKGSVIAFDGDPENVERLQNNSVRNKLQSSLQVIHAAVWSRTVSAGISFRRGISARSQGGVNADGHQPVIGRGEIITVSAITLDDFIANGAPAPQLIKIDVEGGEFEVLRGGPRFFSTHQPLLIVEVHHQQAADQIAEWLTQYQYQAHWHIPKEKFPQSLFAWCERHDGEAWIRDTYPRQNRVG